MYWLILFLCGLVTFTVGSFIVDPDVGGVTLQLRSLAIGFSATCIFASLIAAGFKWTAEEPTLKALRELRGLHAISASMAMMGIERMTLRRRDIAVSEIEDTLACDSTIYLMARNFGAINFAGVRRFIKRHLKRGGTVQLIVEGTNQTLTEICAYRDGLQDDMKLRFQVRQAAVVPFGIYANERIAYVTVYYSDAKGDECPVIVCRHRDDSKATLFEGFVEDFGALWETSNVVCMATR